METKRSDASAIFSSPIQKGVDVVSDSPWHLLVARILAVSMTVPESH